MKLELPLAILLLAIGGWHWMSGYPSNKTNQSKASPTSPNDAEPQKQSPNLLPPQMQSNTNQFGAANQFGSIQQASYQEPIDSVFSEEPDADDPGLLLAQSAKHMEMAPPISCKSRCRINLFGQSIVGEGFYYQQGQGSKLTRMELKYNISDDLSFISTQVCDGKFYYSIQEMGEDRTIEFIDLQRLRSESMNFASSPSRWLSQAGTVSLLRNLSAAFEFEPPQTTTLGSHPMLHLKGKWKPKALASILHGQIDVNESQPFNWDQLPNQIPHAVEVYLGTDDFLHLFPYRINFYKCDREGNPEETPMIAMELFEVQKVDQLPNQLFRVDSQGSHPVDLSQNYSEHLEHLAEAVHESATLRR